MKACANKCLLRHWVAALLRLHCAEPKQPKDKKFTMQSRHRHAAFLELP